MRATGNYCKLLGKTTEEEEVLNNDCCKGDWHVCCSHGRVVRTGTTFSYELRAKLNTVMHCGKRWGGRAWPMSTLIGLK